MAKIRSVDCCAPGTRLGCEPSLTPRQPLRRKVLHVFRTDRHVAELGRPDYQSRWCVGTDRDTGACGAVALRVRSVCVLRHLRSDC